jgi:putative hemolysin
VCRYNPSVPAVATELLLVALLLLLNGVLAMSEIAVVSARKARLRRQADGGDGAALAALELAEDPTRFLSTVQIGITLVGILAGAFGGATIAEQLGDRLGRVPALAPYADAIGLAVVVAAITYLSLVFGELVPKRLGLAHPERVARLVARPMRALARVAGPVVSLLSLSTGAVLRLLPVRPAADAGVSEDDVRALLAEGARVGVFAPAELEIVESVFELGDARVRELMTPRPLVAWLDLDDPPEAAWRAVAAAPHSYYPVCRGHLDELVGVLSLKELTGRLLAGERPSPADLVRRPLFFPERLPAFAALERFKQEGPHVALVVDEHGGVAGLITPTDVLEAMVGELAPTDGAAPGGPVRRPDGSWALDGLMPIGEAIELLGIGGVPPAERAAVDTLGGLAMAELGRVPAVGDRFTWRGVRFEVIDMDGRRVDKLLAEPADESSAPPAAG